MIACARTKEWDKVTKHLRQDVFANQCLIESLEMNSPPVPRDVWIAQKSPDQIVGVMVVEEMPHLPCVAIRVTLSEAIPVLFHSLEPGKKYLFTIGADFRDQLLAGVSEPTDQLEIVSFVLSTDEDFRPFKGVGEVRHLRLTDKSLTDEFPSPSSGDPPLSRFVEWAEDKPEGQRVFGLLTEETIVSFVQFGHLLDELWEVGMIRTREEHKGKGFAKAVLSEASSQLLQEGKIPFYQVRLSNVASLRTAKAVGYREVFRLFSCSGQIAAN